jgi:hypothetical protein
MIRSKLTAMTVAGVLSVSSMAVFAQSDAPVDKGGMPPSTEMNAGSADGNALPPGTIPGGNGDDASGSSTSPGAGSDSMSGGSSMGSSSGSGSGESGSSGMSGSGSGGSSGSAGGGTGSAGGGSGGSGGY